MQRWKGGGKCHHGDTNLQFESETTKIPEGLKMKDSGIREKGSRDLGRDRNAIKCIKLQMVSLCVWLELERVENGKRQEREGNYVWRAFVIMVRGLISTLDYNSIHLKIQLNTVCLQTIHKWYGGENPGLCMSRPVFKFLFFKSSSCEIVPIHLITSDFSYSICVMH